MVVVYTGCLVDTVSGDPQIPPPVAAADNALPASYSPWHFRVCVELINEPNLQQFSVNEINDWVTCW